MKYKLTRKLASSGFGGSVTELIETSVVELDKDAEVPEGAEAVDNKTPVHDWRQEEVDGQ